MRTSTLLNKALKVDGIWFGEFEQDTLNADSSQPLIVNIHLRNKRLCCPHCDYTTSAKYDTRGTKSRWRHLDFCGRQLYLTTRRRRLRCPTHNVVSEGVSFARANSELTRDYEELVAWLTIRSDRTTVAKFLRIAWRTVGKICERICAEQLDDSRFDGLINISVDEISWRKHHNYLTVIINQQTGKVISGSPGKNAEALNTFFDTAGAERTAEIQTVSMDLGRAFQKSVREKAPDATICFDPFHVVQLATKALDEVRRIEWQKERKLPDSKYAKLYKGSRWTLLKNPDNLTAKQQETLKQFEVADNMLWKAYRLKEALRYLFTDDLNLSEITRMIALWCDRAIESGLAPFVTAGNTIREHAAGIEASIQLGLSNGQHEGLNNKIRTASRRAYGFHSAKAMLDMVMLMCGPVKVTLPYR